MRCKYYQMAYLHQEECNEKLSLNRCSKVLDSVQILSAVPVYLDYQANELHQSIKCIEYTLDSTNV